MNMLVWTLVALAVVGLAVLALLLGRARKALGLVVPTVDVQPGVVLDIPLPPGVALTAGESSVPEEMPGADGHTLHLERDGQPLSVTAVRLENNAAAKADFRRLYRHLRRTYRVRTRIFSHTFSEPRFTVGGYGPRTGRDVALWQAGVWLFLVLVPMALPDHAAVRQALGDAVLARIRALNSAQHGRGEARLC